MKKGICSIVSVIAVVVLLLLDRFTKYLAVTHLKGQADISVVRDIFVLHYLENKGAAFGIMQERQILFYVATVVILVVMAVIFWKLPLKKRFLPLYIIVILIFAGALGNFIDRVIQQYVVDFFYFKLINFPIFNVADIYVTGAAIAFIVLLLFYYKEEDFNEIFHGSRN
jgi:signal peptidase II